MVTSSTFISSFFFLAIICRSLAQTPVLDTDGKPVLAGVDYYAVPLSRLAGGGGLGLEGSANKTCPLDVIQVPSRTSKGLPLFFLPVNPSSKTVEIGVDQNVQFNASSICAMPTLWTLRGNIPDLFVTTGGKVGNPGRQTLSNWFGVERFENGYVFRFCPAVCDTCRPFCGNVGVVVEDGRRMLQIGRDLPLKFAFQRV